MKVKKKENMFRRFFPVFVVLLSGLGFASWTLINNWNATGSVTLQGEQPIMLSCVDNFADVSIQSRSANETTFNVSCSNPDTEDHNYAFSFASDVIDVVDACDNSDDVNITCSRAQGESVTMFADNGNTIDTICTIANTAFACPQTVTISANWTQE